MKKLLVEGDDMCGRFTITVSIEALKEYLKAYYDIDECTNQVRVPQYNVAPGQEVISIINDGNKNRIGLLKWGFIPSYARNERSGYKIINAKSETLDQKPSFKEALEHQRCVILADGFYEWKNENHQKTPMRIVLKNQHIFPMAGLWTTYTKEDGTKLHTCTIITTQANTLVASIHERMPVILTESNRKIWLDPTTIGIKKLNSLLQPYDAKEMKAYEVSTLVNQVKNDTIDCITPKINTSIEKGTAQV